MAHNKYKLCLHLSDLMQNTTCDDSSRWPTTHHTHTWCCVFCATRHSNTHCEMMFRTNVSWRRNATFGYSDNISRSSSRIKLRKSGREREKVYICVWVMTQKYDESELTYICMCIQGVRGLRVNISTTFFLDLKKLISAWALSWNRTFNLSFGLPKVKNGCLRWSR